MSYNKDGSTPYLKMNLLPDEIMFNGNVYIKKDAARQGVKMVDMYPRDFVLHILGVINEGYYKPEELDETYHLWLTEWGRNAKT